MEETTNEEWRSIPEFYGIYEASNLGRIKRVKPARGARAGKILTHRSPEGRYSIVDPYIDNVKYTRYVHKLVAEAFLGPRPPRMEINHKDGDKTNNAVANLEYLTPEDNMSHAVGMGLMASGDRNGTHKHPESYHREKYSHSILTYEDVREIRRLISSGEKQYKIAEKFGVCHQEISRIKSGIRWGYVE